MYQDTSLNSYEVIKMRQARQHEVSVERKRNILQKTQDNLAKEELARHYFIKHGVRPNKQQQFFLSPLRLRDLLIKKATDKQYNKAASKIQNWFRGRKRREGFLHTIRAKLRAIRYIQYRWRKFMYETLLPRRAEADGEEKAMLIQRCLHGYGARRVILREKAEKQAEALF